MSRGHRRRGRDDPRPRGDTQGGRAETVTTAVRAETITPVATAVVHAGTTTRRARRRQARRRRLVVGAAVLAGLLAVAGASAGGWWLLAGRDDGGPTPHAAAATGVASTVLLELTAEDGTGVGAALLGAGRGERSSVLMVPVRLIVDVPGIGSQPLAEAVDLPRPDSAAKAVSDLVDLRVDATWALPATGLGRLVDAVGGVTVDVDREVLHKQTDGTTVVVVPEGTQRLDGVAATAYATYSAADEPEQVRSARLKKVLQAVLERLPAGPQAVAGMVADLGSTTPADAGLATLLAEMHAHATAGQVDYDVLPTRVLETGGAQEALTIDAAPAAQTVARLFPSALRATPGTTPIRVLVENGVGTAGLGESARDRLVAAGFTFVSGGNAPQLGVTATVVVVRDATPQSRTTGARVAKALGVSADALRISAREQTVADVVVILGADFRR